MTTPLADVVAPPNEEGTKATILRWCKGVGDTVRKDEPLLELETDKVTVEVPAPAGGEIAEILKQPNEEVLPGQVLARVRIGAPASHHSVSAVATALSAPAPAVVSADDGRQLLSPAVRRMLNENSLTVTDVAGSGRNGRVTAQDVARHLDERVHDSEQTAKHRRPSQALDGTPKRAASRDLAKGTRLPHTPVRKRVAEHVARSVAEAPHVTTLFEADLSKVHAHRALHAAEYQRQGAKLTYTAYFIAACARALMAHRAVNATFHEDGLELHPDANIGIGTALGNEGLIVPVLHGAQDLKLLDIARRLGELVSAARAGKLAPQEVRGGTFTISNHGVGGSLLAAPIIINQPQVAILGVGKVERRVCVLESQGSESIGVRTRCYLTLTIDHRALDAFQANSFLAHVVKSLEDWADD